MIVPFQRMSKWAVLLCGTLFLLSLTACSGTSGRIMGPMVGTSFLTTSSAPGTNAVMLTQNKTLDTVSLASSQGAKGRVLDEKPSLDVMIGQMIMVGFRGEVLEPQSAVRQAVEKGLVGGVLLFNRDVLLKTQRNIISPEQVQALVADLKKAAPGTLLVAVDQEGGKVERLNPNNGFKHWPSAQSLGAGSPEQTLANAIDMGKSLAALGFNVNFAPVVDLNVNPSSPAIGAMERSYGADPAQVVAHAAAFAEGMNAAGLLACLKHFPGHGNSTADTHDGFTDISNTWTKQELEPFAQFIHKGWPGMIMTSHVSLSQFDPDYPASLSSNILGILRKDLGFDGVIVSDDLYMAAVTKLYSLEETIFRAVEAGTDILLFGNNTDYNEEIGQKVHAHIKRLVEDGKISPQRIEESWERIQRMKQGLENSALSN